MRDRGFRAGWLMPACVMLAAVPTHAQDVNLERAMEALRQAERARAEALTRLEDADRLIAEARQLIAERGGAFSGAEAPRLASPASSQGDATRLAASDTIPAEKRHTALGAHIAETPPLDEALRTLLHQKASRPDAIAGFAANKEGDNVSLGLRLNERFPQEGDRDRPHSRSFEVAGIVRTDKTRGSEIARFTPDGASWASDLALRADVRWAWFRQVEPGDISRAAVGAALEESCLKANPFAAERCATTSGVASWVAGLSESDKSKLEAVALLAAGPYFGLEKDGKSQNPRYLAGIKGQHGWLTESYFPAGTLPLTADDEAPLKDTFNPLSAKVYVGASLLPGPKDVWNLTAVASLGWQRAFVFPRRTEDEQICLFSPSRGYTRCATFNLSAPNKAEGMTTGLGINLITPKLGNYGKLRGAAFWQRDFALDQSLYTGELAFALDKDGGVTSGLRYTHRTEGIGPLGNLIKRDGSLTVFLTTDLPYPFIP